MAKIYLDAGHGGKDSGAVGHGIQEKDIVLDICKRIRQGLEEDYQDVQVRMSRDSDVFLELSERTKDANTWGADVLISVHTNGHTSLTAKGFESFIYTNVNAQTVAFQNVLHAEIMRAMGNVVVDREKKSRNFHMVRESAMPAVLTENLFITNKGDAELLKSDAFRQKIAEGHIVGLERFLGLKKADRPSPPKNEKLYKVQVGAFEEKKNAEAMVEDLRKLGYRPFIKYE